MVPSDKELPRLGEALRRRFPPGATRIEKEAADIKQRPYHFFAYGIQGWNVRQGTLWRLDALAFHLPSTWRDQGRFVTLAEQPTL